MKRVGKPRAVVIGSGFGGLAAAVRLAARGLAVTVLEKMDAPGGRAYVHRQDGHVFDAGPTIVTAPYLFEELWQLCGRRFADDVTLKALDPFYEVRFDDGDTIAYTVTLEHGEPAIGNVRATGTITVSNPNTGDAVVDAVTDTVAGCTVAGQPAPAIVPAGGSTDFAFSCDFGSDRESTRLNSSHT